MTQNDTPPPYLDFDPATARLRLDPHEPRFVQNPYEAYAWLHGASGGRSSGKIMASGASAASTTSTACCATAVSAARTRPASPTAAASDRTARTSPPSTRIEANSMLELEPPVHTRLRTLVNRAFVSRQVERLRPRVEALANELIDRFEPGEPVDLLPAFAAPLPITIIAEMLGVPVEMGPQLLDWSHQMVAMYMHGRTRETEDDGQPRGARLLGFPARLCRRAAQEARRRPAVAADLGAGGRPEAFRGRTGLVGHPAAQRRPRGDGPPDRQRRALDPGARRRPAPLLRLAGGDRGNRRGMPALRRAAAYVHALCL